MKPKDQGPRRGAARVSAGAARPTGTALHENALAKVGPLVAVLPIILLLTAVYGRALDAPLVFDDHSSVVDNPSILSLWPPIGAADTPGPLRPPQQASTAGRPLVNLSLAVNYRFGALEPRGYHVFNLVIHALSALLVWGIVRRSLRLEFFAERFTRVADWLALCVALVWAVHPLQTEAVEYITQRTELLVGFFYLATLYVSMRYWGATAPRCRAGWLTLATCSSLAGMASKEVMVSAPLVVLLFERTFLAGSFRRALYRSWPLYACLALGWLLLAALNFSGPRSQSAGFHLGLPLWPWWFTQAEVLVMYLRLAFWPCPLAIHYGFPLVDSLTIALPYLLAVAALVVATLVLVARRAAAGFLLATVLLILAPTSIVPIKTEVAAERRMYLPLAAILSLAVVGGYALTERAMRSRSTARPPTGNISGPLGATLVCSLAVVIVFGTLSARRLTVYNDLLAFWLDAVARQPLSYTNQTNAGIALRLAGRLPDAVEHFAEAVRLNPDAGDMHNNLGFALVGVGRPADAVLQLEQAQQLSPESAEVRSNLGMALYGLGRTAEAIAMFREAVRLKPDFADAHLNLAIALAAADRTGEAVPHFEEALHLRPQMTDALLPLAAAYRKLARTDEAIAMAQYARQQAQARGDAAAVANIDGWLKELTPKQAP